MKKISAAAMLAAAVALAAPAFALTQGTNPKTGDCCLTTNSMGSNGVMYTSYGAKIHDGPCNELDRTGGVKGPAALTGGGPLSVPEAGDPLCETGYSLKVQAGADNCKKGTLAPKAAKCAAGKTLKVDANGVKDVCAAVKASAGAGAAH